MSVLGRLGGLINDDGEVVNLLAGNDEGVNHVSDSVGGVEEARGSVDPPPTQHR